MEKSHNRAQHNNSMCVRAHAAALLFSLTFLPLTGLAAVSPHVISAVRLRLFDLEQLMMMKLLVFILLVIIGVGAAGIYGALHNQISYTVSPEYFTKFKFQQFGYADTQAPERIRASFVGFDASWWMGIPIGLLIGIAGFIHRGYRQMLKISLQAMGVAVAFTLFFGLCGLVYGFVQTSNFNPADYHYWYLPDGVVDMRRFLCAGYMHNSAYLGGVLSILAAWSYHVFVKVKTKGAL
jgi:hypothetical protein